MGKILDLLVPLHRCANDNQIPGKFSQELPAGTARYDWFGGVGNHSDRDEFPLSCRDSTADRDSLGTNRQPIRDIFDVAADKNIARFTLKSRSNGKVRIWRVSFPTRSRSGLN